VTRSAAPKLRAYAVLISAALLAAVALRRGEILLLAAPFAGFLAFGLGSAAEPALQATSMLVRDRIVEGDTVEFDVRVASDQAVPWLEVGAVLPALMESAGSRVSAQRLDSARDAALSLSVRPLRWGVYRVGQVAVRCRDAYGLWIFEGLSAGQSSLRVLPRAESLQSFIEPVATRGFAGAHLARTTGAGIEFAALRPYLPNDPASSIAWRASARRGALVVADRHPERSSDAVIFLDTFEPAGAEVDGTLADGIRAAAALAAAALEQRDRVGLVAFGGVLRWLVPAGGDRQLYRIIDALLESEAVVSYAWKGVDVIPRRSLPPGALVIAVSPLVDQRSQTALLDLRRRGFDVAIIEVSPLAHVHHERRDTFAELALRLWRLRREALRARYREAGIAVTGWTPPAPLDAVVREVIAFRRSSRIARA
jgi:uncharacterized protein (DUF58 family)